MFLYGGEEVTELRWNAPDTREDGSRYDPKEHDKYQLGVSTNTGDIKVHTDIPAGYIIESWPLDMLKLKELGTYNLTIRAVDTNGYNSEWSDCIKIEVVQDCPKAPTGLIAV